MGTHIGMRTLPGYLPGSDAINRASQPASPRQQHDRESERSDPEAGQ
jgi:hypothetical protein